MAMFPMNLEMAGDDMSSRSAGSRSRKPVFQAHSAIGGYVRRSPVLTRFLRRGRPVLPVPFGGTTHILMRNRFLFLLYGSGAGG